MRNRSCVFIFIFVFAASFSFSDSSPFGINVHTGSDRVLQKTEEAGIRWVRVDLIWSRIEAEKGVRDYSDTDRIVEFCRKNGLEILGVLSSTPGWSNRGRGPNFPADHAADWKDFVSETAARFEKDIRYWNIWNEPNVEKFFALGKDEFVRQIFIPAAEAIKARSPFSFIVGPELAHLGSTGSEWYFWMKYILTECGQYIDIVSHHIYKNSGVYAIYESLEIGENITPSVRKVIEDSGFAAAPFWITETGWDTELFSEEEQANRYLEFLKEMSARDYPHKIFFYEIIDDNNPGVRPWGIIRADFSEKPSYGIYRDFIAGLYPEDEDPETNEFSKKCYMEDSVNRSGLDNKGRVLANLRKARDAMAEGVPFFSRMVSLYYRSGKILKGLASIFPGFRTLSIETASLVDLVFESPALKNLSILARLNP